MSGVAEVGVDIVELARIRSIYDRFGQTFMKKILTAAEMAQCLSRPDPVASLAGRFAAKEAVSKALGTGIAKGLGWRSIEVLNNEAGKPCVSIHVPNFSGSISLSISHDRHSAVAMALYEPL
ncbi:holo-ACP synthase [Chlorobaculum sp. 24CR]|uniref:holo-ACP synthase n=1 Tax=Chlorobaculum sp. 24CR TaxID=2508878 RepID=UPI001430E123|nr:holo-ACP synthase [Chlorobaculum sp. 24CR]